MIEASLQANLLSFIRETSLFQRCRVLLSANVPFDEHMPFPGSLMTASDAPLSLTLPPLRERQDDIASLASLYINHYNFLLGRQVSGLDDEALQLLRSFTWPLNTAQFTRVLRQLVLTASQPLLTISDTQRILADEPGLKHALPESALLEGTLDDIMRAAIERVLAQEGMNQSRAAKRLGISRSTLWRKLQS